MIALRRVLVLVLLGLALIAPYQWIAYHQFAANLSSFQLSLSKSGLPGEPQDQWIFKSDGYLSRTVTVKDSTRVLGVATLTSQDIETVRMALRGMWRISGPYDQPFWDRKLIHNYLRITVTLSDGSQREAMFSNAEPVPVRQLIAAINSVVKPDYIVAYRKY